MSARQEGKRPGVAAGAQGAGKQNARDFENCTSIQSSAQAYIDAGLALVPIPAGSKGPRLRGWNTRRRCVADEAGALRFNGGSIGLAHAFCEPRPTCAIDVDDMSKAVPWLKARGIDLQRLLDAPDAVQIVSGRPGRAKLVYRLPAALVTKKPTDSGIELRCATAEGLTVQDVMPPSIHPDTGKPYTWHGDWRSIPTIPEPLHALWRGLGAETNQPGSTDTPAPIGTVPPTWDMTKKQLPRDLPRLVPDERQTWIDVGIALFHESGGTSEGLHLWNVWSAGSTKFVPGECAQKWSGFKPTSEARLTWNGIRRKYKLEEPVEGDNAEHSAPESIWPQPLNLIALSKTMPPEPRYIIDGWLPAGYATLFSAHGGTGKSIIALTQAITIAMGLDFAGRSTRRSRVLYLSCEDRQPVLHWRIVRICEYLGVSMKDLDGWLFVVDLVGHDSLLWVSGSGEKPRATEAFARVKAQVQGTGAQVLYFDGVADVYGGDENVRPQVKQFVNSLVSLIDANTGAVVLIGHVNRVTAGSGHDAQGYSGSTGWHNSVRARWFLHPEQKSDESDKKRRRKTGRLVMELQKNQHGVADDRIALQWSKEHRTFEILDAEDIDPQLQAAQERQGILLAMREVAEAGDYVPAATQGPRTAFHVLRARTTFAESMKEDNAANKRRFWDTIEWLRAIGHIKQDTIARKDRHKKDAIVITTEGMRACGQ